MLPCCDSMSCFYFLDAETNFYIYHSLVICGALTFSRLWHDPSICFEHLGVFQAGSPTLKKLSRGAQGCCPKRALDTWVPWRIWLRKIHVLVVLSQHSGALMYPGWHGAISASTFEIWDVWSAVAAQRVADSPDKTWIHLYIVIVLSCHCLLAQSMYLWMSAVAALRTK